MSSCRRHGRGSSLCGAPPSPLLLLSLLAALLLLAGGAGAAAAAGTSSNGAFAAARGAEGWLQSAWDYLLRRVASSPGSTGWRWGLPASQQQQRDEEQGDQDGPVQGVQWALLIAGSNGWWNYRHQADVLHAYQVLRGGGLHPDRIVLMVYDDLALNPTNPFQGQVFNRPGGPDVYAGAQIDYSGNDVNAQTFLAVLAGNTSAVTGIGSGKVIASGPNDHVFVFYSDHGSPGVLGMPSGSFLFADELNACIRRKHAARGFREMTLYIEACESGSMFEGLLDASLNVYATTAANAEESSWGTYCPGMDIPPDLTGLDTCMGDLYSVAWMEDTECEDTTTETLKDQFELVKLRTSHNYTYNMGSHVMQYGRIAMESEHVAEYLGPRDASACQLPSDSPADITPSSVLSARSSKVRALLSGGRGGALLTPKLLGRPGREGGGASAARCPRGKRCNPLRASAHGAHVAQREADLVTLRVRAARAKSHEDRRHAQAELDAEVSRRRQVDHGLEAATARLLTLRGASQSLMSTLGWTPQHVFRAHHTASTEAENRLVPDPSYVQQLLTSASLMGRGPGSGRPLVDSWACLKGMVAAYQDVCGAMDQYAMRHTRLFANLCNAGVQPEALAQSLQLVGGCPTGGKVPEVVDGQGRMSNSLVSEQ